MNYCATAISTKDFQTTRTIVENALQDEGFGILTEIDIQETMKKKLDKDYLPHLILGACSPVYADKVLQVDPHISTLLPCNVTLREMEDGRVEVAAINPAAAMQVVQNKAVETYAEEIQQKLQKVLHKVN